MLDQFGDTVCNPLNGSPWPGSTSTSDATEFAQTGQRAQVDAECIQVRFHGVYAHIGRDAGDHLVGGKEQAVLGPVQHGLLERMTAAGDHPEIRSPTRSPSPCWMR